MLDLVGNPNCWFCHAQAQLCTAKETFSVVKCIGSLNVLDNVQVICNLSHLAPGNTWAFDFCPAKPC